MFIADPNPDAKSSVGATRTYGQHGKRYLGAALRKARNEMPPRWG